MANLTNEEVGTIYILGLSRSVLNYRDQNYRGCCTVVPAGRAFSSPRVQVFCVFLCLPIDRTIVTLLRQVFQCVGL